MKLSPSQLDVLARLASCDEPLAYCRGGWWTTQAASRQTQDSGKTPEWHTVKGTVRALEKVGLLKPTGASTNYPIESYPQLADRVLSAKGLAVATGTDTPAHGLVEAVAAYTGRVLHYSSYRVLDDADWAALVELEPSLKDGTAAFISDGGDIFIHVGYEADALHELVHAAGVKPSEGDNVFVCEGLTQVATEEIAETLSIRVRKNYKNEVSLVREYLVPATELKARDLVALYIEHGLEGLARAVFGRSHYDALQTLVAELRQATGPGQILKSLVATRRVR